MLQSGGLSHLLWTFQVVGGTPFDAKMPGNPRVAHHGGTSVFHLVATQEEATQMIDLAERAGCGVHAESGRRQTGAQRAIRMALLGAGREDRAWPCAECPSCYWFDPLIENGMPCGAVQWDEGTRRTSLEHPKAVTDLAVCPVKKG